MLAAHVDQGGGLSTMYPQSLRLLRLEASTSNHFVNHLFPLGNWKKKKEKRKQPYSQLHFFIISSLPPAVQYFMLHFLQLGYFRGRGYFVQVCEVFVYSSKVMDHYEIRSAGIFISTRNISHMTTWGSGFKVAVTTHSLLHSKNRSTPVLLKS